MISFKRFAWSGVAVVFALILSLGLMAQSTQAAVSVGTNETFNVALGTNAATGSNTCTTNATNLVLAVGANSDVGAGSLTIAAPAGWTFCSGTVTALAGNTATVAVATNTLTVTTTGANTATGNMTISATIKPNTDASVGGNVTVTSNTASALPAAGTVVGSVTTTAANAAYSFSSFVVLPPGTACDATQTAAAPTQPVTVPSDGSLAYVLCAKVLDSSGNAAAGVPVTFTVSQGIVSTGTSKTVLVISNSTGFATTTYRGSCNCTTTDTAIAAYAQHNAVATQSINLVPASGGTANKLTFQSPVSLAVAATVNNTTPGYISFTTGTNVALQVQDASGNGVNGQVILLSTDKGGLILGFNQTCPSTVKSITATSATGPLSAGGTDLKAGVVAFTFCGNQSDAPGKATITAQNITTSMANATTSVSMAGRPAKITAVATGNAITATVVDAGGNNVADGTPVRFTISSNAGAVSTACSLSTNGQASAVVSLIAATGTVIVSTDWNETGAAATCAAAGAQQLATSVTVPGGTSSSGGTTPPAGGAGSITSGSIPAAGGFGLIVASGDIKGVVTASGCPAATMALWATVNGNFVTYVPGTSITAVNADFLAAFPGGILPAGTPLIGKCK